MKVKGSLYWIYSFTSGCKGKMLVAILLAVIGVLCGMAPYFALAGILSGLIQNTLTAERIFCYVGIAVLGLLFAWQAFANQHMWAIAGLFCVYVYLAAHFLQGSLSYLREYSMQTG